MKNRNIHILLLASILISIFGFRTTVYASCPLGADVTKDLYNILNIFKIVAPILVFVFTFWDGIRTVMTGDPGSDMKKFAIKTAKRLGYALLLFFLPIIIDQVMQIADVWDANGTCDLSNPTGNDAPENA